MRPPVTPNSNAVPAIDISGPGVSCVVGVEGDLAFSGVAADFDSHVRAGLSGEDEEGPDGFPGGRPGREPGVHVLLGEG